MAEQAWWITVLQWTAWFGLMSLVMGWLARSRLRARAASDAHRLRYPPSTLIVGLVCFAFFAGIAVVSNLYPNETATWWTTAIFVGFALLSAPMVAGFVFQHHDVSNDGLAYRNVIGARKDLRWSDLKAVRYSPTKKSFRLETRTGDTARISAMLMGLPEFARVLLEHTPKEAIDARTVNVLEATAAGNPPSVWT